MDRTAFGQLQPVHQLHPSLDQVVLRTVACTPALLFLRLLQSALRGAALEGNLEVADAHSLTGPRQAHPYLKGAVLVV